jgi:hypothetical protein
MRLELAAGCPKIAAGKIMDLCGVIYASRRQNVAMQSARRGREREAAAPGLLGRCQSQCAIGSPADRLAATAGSVTPDHWASPVEAIVDAAADDHAGMLNVDAHRLECQVRRIQAIDV